jgi:uncharacterized protein YfaS (alpha-2-macroglobulin family)
MAVKSTAPVNFALNATGIQRLDKLEPEGREVRISRMLTTVDGKPLPGRIAPGTVLAVRLALDLEKPQSYLIVEGPRPSGCEFADEHLEGSAAVLAAGTEFRDDRVAVFFPALPAGRHELVYFLRAETRGRTHLLPAMSWPMYNDRLRGATGAETLNIE